ncbi:LLM class flavin-dependent oxidoreductase, partial [Lactobacillus sp. XV13L]|nr:LLM class flavin-dependent oxidoreductase [Lactobacillus sp. XV13L]
MKIDVNNLKFGLESFGDVPFDDQTHERLSDAQSLRGIVKEGQLADNLGIDVIGLGEHHRREFSVSSPELVLSNLASVTENIHLSTAVTVLSTDDPVRVFERFSTLQALSNGRAEVMLGRGSFTESFPLYGYKLEDYDELFEEKLKLFSELLKGEPVTWKGKLTQDLDAVTVYPQLEQHLP